MGMGLITVLVVPGGHVESLRTSAEEGEDIRYDEEEEDEDDQHRHGYVMYQDVGQLRDVYQVVQGGIENPKLEYQLQIQGLHNAG
jgi:hypothetical protein